MAIRYLSGINVDSNTLFVDDANNRVGIGTGSPVSPLDVNGIISSRGIFVAQNSGTYNVLYNASNSVSIYLGGSADQGNYYDNTTHYFRSPGGGTTYAVINYLGNVGIGTTAPNEKLDVNGDVTLGWGANRAFKIKFYGGGTYEAGMRLASGGRRLELFSIFDDSAEGISFTTGTGASNSEKMRLTNAGNLGIGTDSPSQKLHVQGNSIVAGQSFLTSGFSSYTTDGLFNANALWSGMITPSGVYRIRFGYLDEGGGQYWGRIGFVGNTNWSLGTSQGGNSFSIGTDNGNNQFLIDNAGNVGIGTTSPVTTLQVNATSPAIRLQETSSGGDKRLELSVNSSGVATIAANQSAQVLTFETVGSERMRIASTGATRLNAYGSGSFTGTVAYNLAVDSSGNIIETAGGVVDGSGTANYITRWVDGNTVGDSAIYQSPSGGIGIYNTTPTRALEVGGSIVVGMDNPAPFWNALFKDFNDGSGIYISSVNGGGGKYIAGNAYYYNSALWRSDKTVASAINLDNGTVVFYTNSGLTPNVDYSPTERMRITSDGNVAINSTTTSGYRLYVNGSTWINGGTNFQDGVSIFRTESGAAEVMRIASNGNVGIGTTTPAQKLHVVGNTTITGVTYTDVVQTYSGASIDFRHQDASVVMRVDTANARVGIGTTSPSYKLDVSGDIRSTTIDLGTQGVNVSSYGFLSQTLSGQMTFLGHNVRASSTVNNTALVVNGGWISSLIKQYYNEGITFHTSTTEYAAGATYPLADTERMRITSAGNVGIGTTAPATRLQVDASGHSLVVSNDTGNRRIYFGTGATGEPDIQAALSNGTVRQLSINAAGGNVGIGTTAPTETLDLRGVLRVSRSGVNDSGIIAFGNYANGAGYYDNGIFRSSLNAITTSGNVLHMGSYEALAFTTSTNPLGSQSIRMYISGSTGNVGIGTTSPSTKLEVGNFLDAVTNKITVAARYEYEPEFNFRLGQSGTNLDWIGAVISSGDDGNYNGKILFKTANAGRDTPTTKMVIKANGNVGIGTTSPGSLLTVGGNVRIVTGTTQGLFAFDASTGGAFIWSITRYTDTNPNDININARNGFAIRTGVTSLTNSGHQFYVTSSGNVGIGTTSPSQALHVSGSARVTGAYYDSNNSAGSSGQVLSSTGSGTAWVNQGEATATSLFDLLPAARTTYDWTVQLTAGTWADIFSSNTVLSNGTWMVQVFVNDWAVGGQQYSETYSGIMSWGEASSTNQGGAAAISEIVLHRSGHAANAGNFYLRTVERVTSTLLLQGMSNQTYSAASTINFKFVKIF